MSLPPWAINQIEKLLRHGFGQIRLVVRDGQLIKVIVSPAFVVTPKGPRVR